MKGVFSLFSCRKIIIIELNYKVYDLDNYCFVVLGSKDISGIFGNE